MAVQNGRTVKEGVGLGIVAGVIFGIVEMVGASMMEQPALMPIRMFASTLLGRAALEATPLGTAVVVGTAMHLAFSGVFGAIYTLLAARLPAEAKTQPGRQIGIGLLYGVALWFVNFQIVARLVYPWFLDAPQLMQATMHAFFYGIPLGLLYAGAEKRVRRAAPVRA